MVFIARVTESVTFFQVCTDCLVSSCAGEGSCRFDSIKEHEDDGDPSLDRYPVHSIVFEPALGGNGSKCSCNTIKR